MTGLATVYFHIEKDVLYEDGFAYLAEGFSALGITCYGSRDYWAKADSSSPLVLAAALGDRRWSVVFLSNNAYRYDTLDEFGRYHIREQTPDLTKLSAHTDQVVLLDLQDGYSDLGADDRQIHRIYRSKFNVRVVQSPKSQPYVLGIQQRCLSLAPREPDTTAPPRTILDTFGFTHPYAHGTRTAFRSVIAPLMARAGIQVHSTTVGSLRQPPENEPAATWWRLTGGKHNPDYYALVRAYPVHACFCGEIVPSTPANPGPLLKGGHRARLRYAMHRAQDAVFGRTGRLIQWDSWRFWETLALGSVPLMFDLEKLGVKLPVMPENWRHYIGLDPRNPRQSVLELAARWSEIPRIAAAGRGWLIEYYSPAANARRLCHELGLYPRV